MSFNNLVLLNNKIPNWVIRGNGIPVTVDYNFAKGLYYGAGGLSCTRSTTGYAQASNGNWTSFGSGVPRITDQGLLVEEQRTNSIRNSTMQGAVAGSPGTLPTNWYFGNLRGLSSSVVATGTSNGIPYIQVRIYGTPTSTGGVALFSDGYNISVSSGQTWSGSVFLALVAGSLTNVTGITLRWDEGTSTPTFIQTDQSSNLTVGATFTRQSFTYTLNGASVAYILGVGPQVGVTSGQAVDLTLQIGLNQAELGASVSSPIPTTSTSVTRNADVVTLLNPGLPVSAGSLGITFTPLIGPSYATNIPFFSWDDGVISNALELRTSSSNLETRIFAGGSNVGGSASSSTWSAGTSAKLAGSFSAASTVSAVNGSASTPATPTGFPTGLTRLEFGGRGSVAYPNSYISRAWLHNTYAYPASALQAIQNNYS